jgi:hypothetical protein
MRKLQDISLPFRRGVGVEQFITFILVIIVLLIVYGTLVAPLLSLTHTHLNWQFYLLYFLGPATLAGSRVGKPMKSGKTISGSIRSWTRKRLDDPVHRRGVPLRRRPVTKARIHYWRVWQAHPMLARHLPAGSMYEEKPVDRAGRVDIDDWLERVVTSRLDRKPVNAESEEDAWRRRVRGTTGRVVLPDDFDGDQAHEGTV